MISNFPLFCLQDSAKFKKASIILIRTLIHYNSSSSFIYTASPQALTLRPYSFVAPRF